jgi:hypothetical protein
MEPDIHFTDYPSLYPQMIVADERTKKRWEELRDKIVNETFRNGMGGNKGIHSFEDIRIPQRPNSLRSV